MQVVVGRLLATARRQRTDDVDELVAERSRADAVEREVDAVVEAVRHRGDVLGCQQGAGEAARGAR